jgi:hypothetical protein
LRFFQVFYEGIEETALCHIIKMTLLWVKWRRENPGIDILTKVCH